MRSRSRSKSGPAARRSRSEPLNTEELLRLVSELAADLREVVLPELGRAEGRAHEQTGAGGDVTFAIDERAERRLEEFLAERAPDVAFYSEDRGMVVPAGDPEWVLIVDPIDGTRPAMAGLESACVSVAAARLEGEPTMADVVAGCVIEIKSGAAFTAARGEGVTPEPRLAPTREIGRMLWAYGLRGRPVVATATVLEELIDSSSVAGATFDLGSATFDMTRLVTGQLDAYVEPGPRIVAEVEGMAAEFERVGRGADPQQLPLRPRRRGADPRGGRRDRHRRGRQPARRPPPARLRRRVPDVVCRRRHARAERGDRRFARRRHRPACGRTARVA